MDHGVHLDICRWRLIGLLNIESESPYLGLPLIGNWGMFHRDYKPMDSSSAEFSPSKYMDACFMTECSSRLYNQQRSEQGVVGIVDHCLLFWRLKLRGF